MDNLKEALEGLKEMPESELQFVSEDPQKALMDLQIYKRDKSAWEKVKKVRAMFKSPNHP